jgi:membrane associated rhomboid family serine protease
MASLVRDEARALTTHVAVRVKTLAGVTGVLWAVEGADLLLGHRLEAFGIAPRTEAGLLGILFAPFLHAGIAHLAVNTVSLWVLGALAMSRKVADFWVIAVIAALASGLCAWLLGGAGTVHVGASGVIFGFLGFLLARGFFERTLTSIALSIAVAWLFGSMVLGALPFVAAAGISWQAHLGGFVGGLVAARYVLGRR